MPKKMGGAWQLLAIMLVCSLVMEHVRMAECVKRKREESDVLARTIEKPRRVNKFGIEEDDYKLILGGHIKVRASRGYMEKLVDDHVTRKLHEAIHNNNMEYEGNLKVRLTLLYRQLDECRRSVVLRSTHLIGMYIDRLKGTDSLYQSGPLSTDLEQELKQLMPQLLITSKDIPLPYWPSARVLNELVSTLIALDNYMGTRVSVFKRTHSNSSTILKSTRLFIAKIKREMSKYWNIVLRSTFHARAPFRTKIPVELDDLISSYIHC